MSQAQLLTSIAKTLAEFLEEYRRHNVAMEAHMRQIAEDRQGLTVVPPPRASEN